VVVPGDKSIAHRWLLFSLLGNGTSALANLPEGLDVASTARAVAALSTGDQPSLEGWTVSTGGSGWGMGGVEGPLDRESTSGWTGPVRVAGTGRDRLREPEGPVDCGNSGTTMRLLCGVLAGSGIRAVLTGDESLSLRPMERVAEPLRLMGAGVTTTGGRPPVEVTGAPLSGIRYPMPVPSAQVKGAVLLAGLAAEGETAVLEPGPSRDHTERLIAFLGGPVRTESGAVAVSAFDPPSFEGTVPGDVSSAAFPAGAAVVTGGRVTVAGVGLNPTRTRFLDVLERMGAGVERRIEGREAGEPVGEVSVAAGPRILGAVVTAAELPEVVDEVPLLAVVAMHADGESRFEGAAELRVKESDRLAGIVELIRRLGGDAAIEGDHLVVAGGVPHAARERGPLTPGTDHRMAMAAVVGALVAREPVEIGGLDAAGVSFPGFVPAMRALGARIEVLG